MSKVSRRLRSGLGASAAVLTAVPTAVLTTLSCCAGRPAVAGVGGSDVVERQERRTANARWRERYVRLARERDGTVELIYEGAPWRGVFGARALGLRVTSIAGARPHEPADGDREGRELVARVVLGGGAELDVRRDDSIGDATVVAVLPSGVVFVHAPSRTVFFGALSDEQPRFQLVWRSSFSLAPARAKTAPQPPARAKRPAARSR